MKPKPVGNVPRGIEVLVKKAVVDPEFKEVLLKERAEAAKRIGLTLEPSEVAMLTSIPEEQLQTIIANTRVERKHWRTFLGCSAAAMLVAVGATAVGFLVLFPPISGSAPDRIRRIEEAKEKQEKKAGKSGAKAATKGAADRVTRKDAPTNE